MIHAGDIIENPVPGERIRVLQTSQETAARQCSSRSPSSRTAPWPRRHVHPHQTERFEVLEGLLTFRVARREVEARPGDILTVEPGQAHKFWNPGARPARFRCTVRAALQFEQLIGTMFSLAAHGQTNRRGLPNPLRLAVIAKGALRRRAVAFPAGLDAAGRSRPPAPLERLAGLRAAPLS